MLYADDDTRVLIGFLKLYLEAFEGKQQEKALHKFQYEIMPKEHNKYFDYEFSDLGNARRVTDTYGDRIRYCPGKGWFIWNGTVWALDEQGTIYHLIETRLCDIRTEIRAAHDRGAVKMNPSDYLQLYQFAERHVLKNQERHRINAAEELARHQPELCISNADFDRDTFLLSTATGVVDLRTGTLLTHRREDYITRKTPVAYDPDACCPTWMTFLLEIMGDNADLVEYLQRIIGYCLTGDMSEQKIFICYGTGSNGKSTLIETIHALMGDYSKATKFKTFTERGEHALAILATLDKVRLVTASESRSEDALAEDLMKEITGGEAITAKALYKSPFTYYPQFKLILSSNNKPDIKHQDHGTWRRIRLVPFEVTIPEAEQNKDLPQMLRAELPGILAWAVRGAVAWWHDRQAQQDGLKTPQIVLDATEAYKEDMDVIGEFLRDKFVFYENYRVEEKAVYALYEAWCTDNRERYPYKKTNLYKMVEERGYQRKPANGKKWFLGLKPKMDVVAEFGAQYRQSRQ